MEQTDGRNWYDSINKTARFSGGNAPKGLGGTFTEFFFFVPHSFSKYQDHIKKKKTNTLWNFEQSVASSNCEI